MYQKRKITPKLVLLIVAPVVAAYCWHVDFPGFADQPPRDLSGALVERGDKVYQYCVGGFIDCTYCWRIDGSLSTISRVSTQLSLKPSATIPAEFWRLPPYYWPRSQNASMVAYRSLNFSDDVRGSDGPHFFMIHDTSKNRAYVLFKDNF
ncbi:MAG: hypothetical protein ACAI34_18470 [Verrucomicrobium sp.]